MPTGDGDEGDRFGVIADLLDEIGGLLHNLVESVLRPLASVHLVASDDDLTHPKGEGKQSVLAGLAILRDTSLELSDTGSDNQDSTVSLGGTGDHVLNEVAVSGRVDNGDHVSGSLELPKRDIDGDTTLALGLKFVENPCVFEGR